MTQKKVKRKYVRKTPIKILYVLYDKQGLPMYVAINTQEMVEFLETIGITMISASVSSAITRHSKISYKYEINRIYLDKGEYFYEDYT